MDGYHVLAIVIRSPYVGTYSEELIIHRLKKIKRYLKIDIKFRIIYDLGKFSFYCNVKEKIPYEQKHYVIYRLTCPGCGGKYIAKTERCFLRRLKK